MFNKIIDYLKNDGVSLKNKNLVEVNRQLNKEYQEMKDDRKAREFIMIETECGTHRELVRALNTHLQSKCIEAHIVELMYVTESMLRYTLVLESNYGINGREIERELRGMLDA